MSDAKLDIQVLKNILQLNSALPDDYTKCWITVDEMRERLVHCGVDKALSTEILMTALTRANRSGVILQKRPEGKTKYFRPAIYAHLPGTPLDQRKKWKGERRTPISPERDFLVSKSSQSDTVKAINEALKKYDTAADLASRSAERALRVKRGQAATVIQAAFRGHMSQLRQELLEEHYMKLAAQRALSYNNVMVPCQDGDLTANNDSIEAEDDVDGSESCGTPNHNVSDNESFGATDEDDFEEYQYEEYEMDEEPHNFDDMPGNEGYGIFDMQMLTAFIHEVSRHAATCCAPLDLTNVDKRYGAGIDETWNVDLL